MKKIIAFLSFVLLISISTFAQKNKYSFSANAGFFIGHSDGTSIGPGIELKGARKITSSAWLTLGVSYISLKTLDKKVNNDHVTNRLVPIMIGYKQDFKIFSIEPRVGLGELGGRFSIGSDYSKPSVLASFYSLGIGYTFKIINLGLEIGNGVLGIDSPDAGFWHNRKLFYSAFKIGVTPFQKKN